MKRDLRSIFISAVLAAALVISFQYVGRLTHAVQNPLVPPTAGVLTGVQFSQLLGDAFRSLASCNKGPTAPANVGGVAVDGLCWIDDSASPWLKKRFANGGWVVEGAIDNVNGYWVGVVGGGVTSIASASTTNLGSLPQANITITGTTGVSLFGATAPIGTVKFIRFDNALIIAHSASLKVPGGYPLTTAADDRAIVTHLGAGAWEITQYTRASGVPIDAAAVGDTKFTMGAAAPALHVYGAGQALTRTSFPAYLAKVTRAQNATRTSGNATLTSVADTSGMGVGMPLESTGVNAGCTIASVTASTIVLNSAACVTASGTSAATVFFTGYGSGGSATTVGVPNCQGRMLAGRDDAGGTPQNLITAAGSSINGAQKNVAGGAQNVTITRDRLPNETLSATVPNHTHNFKFQLTSTVDNTGSAQFVSNITTSSGSTSATEGTGDVSISTSSLSNGVAQVALNNMPPTLIADCVVRVTP